MNSFFKVVKKINLTVHCDSFPRVLHGNSCVYTCIYTSVSTCTMVTTLQIKTKINFIRSQHQNMMVKKKKFHMAVLPSKFSMNQMHNSIISVNLCVSN